MGRPSDGPATTRSSASCTEEALQPASLLFSQCGRQEDGDVYHEEDGGTGGRVGPCARPVTVWRRSRGGPRSGPGGAVARRLGQVPAERSLDASVRSRRSGRSTPRSGTLTVRVMSCLGPAPVSVTVRRRSRGGPRSGTPRYPSSVRFGSVRFDSGRSSPVISSIY